MIYVENECNSFGIYLYEYVAFAADAAADAAAAAAAPATTKSKFNTVGRFILCVRVPLQQTKVTVLSKLRSNASTVTDTHRE